MTKEMEFFAFLMEQYARYKNTTADKVLIRLDELNLTDYVFNMYEMYHVKHWKMLLPILINLLRTNPNNFLRESCK